jgi:hypothetical protein
VLTAFNGRKNGISWPRMIWFDEHDMKRHAAKNAIKWPKVQKLGITWPKVQIWQTDFIRFSSAFSTWQLIIRTCL